MNPQNPKIQASIDASIARLTPAEIADLRAHGVESATYANMVKTGLGETFWAGAVVAQLQSMNIETLRQKILEQFGTEGFAALESVASDAIMATEWEKLTVQEIRRWAYAELEPSWVSALLAD